MNLFTRSVAGFLSVAVLFLCLSSNQASADECERMRALGVPCERVIGKIQPTAGVKKKAEPSSEATPLPEEMIEAIEKQMLYAPGDVELLFWNGYKFEYVGKNMETYIRSLIGLGKLKKFTIGTGRKFFGYDVKVGGATWSEPESFTVRSDRKTRFVFRVELLR